MEVFETAFGLFFPMRIFSHSEKPPFMNVSLNSWRFHEKVLFRFFFIFLGLSTIFCWDLILSLMFEVKDYANQYHFLTRPFHWLDQHIFHSGYDPSKHESFPQDNHFAVVFYLTFLLIAVAGTICWSVIDRKKSGYDKINYWFRLYLRYTLSLIMIFYGLDKIIPVQMPYPSVLSLLTPLGENDRFNVLWNFMGLSPGYMVLTGACETLSGLLLINLRTTVLGYLLSIVVLVNVVSFNIFYNVPVKMFSTQLLLYALFLLIPHLKSLARYFLLGKTAHLTENRYIPGRRWKYYSLLFILILVPLSVFLFFGHRNYNRYTKDQSDDRQQKIYEVSEFIAKDTLPPLLTDTLRWKRFLLAREAAVIFKMDDSKDYYDFTLDSIRKTLTLHDNPDTLTWIVFQYDFPAQDRFSLSGKWKGQSVQIFMKSIPIDSMRIHKEKILWVNDE